MLKRKILLAEDDEDDQNFFLDFLRSRNDVLLLQISENGEELIDYLNSIGAASGLPHFIILDQNMPKLNGLQTLQMLKKDTRYSHIPAVIYSTYADEVLKERGNQAGACLVASKPSSNQEYDQLINSILEFCGSTGKA